MVLESARIRCVSMIAGTAMVIAVASVSAPACAAELLPICGQAATGADGGCWQKLGAKRNCHVWNPSPRAGESATFDGRSRCRDGKLSGTGTLTWRWTADSEHRSSTTTGTFADGKRNGRFVNERFDGGRSEGDLVDGKPNGHWVNTNPPGTPRLWDRAEGPWVHGVRQGQWTFVDYSDADGEFQESHRLEGPYVEGQRHGDWVRVRGDSRAAMAYEDGKLHGPYVAEFDDGRRQTGEYAEGERAGRWVTVDSAENIIEERNWAEGKLHGVFIATHREMEFQATGGLLGASIKGCGTDSGLHRTTSAARPKKPMLPARGTDRR